MEISALSEEVSWSKHLRNSCHFWVQRVLLPIVVIIGVIGNLLTIVVLTRKRMSCSTNTYLTALAVSDTVLLFSYLFLSFENYPHIKHPDYLPYWTCWRFGLWFADASCAVSVWLTVSFTLERYIAVCHPLKGRVLCTEARARKVIVCVYIICPLVTATTPFEWNVQVQTNSGNATIVVVPTNMGKSETYRTVFYWFWSLSFVLIPLVILIILNSFLINAVHKSKGNRRNLTQSLRRRGGTQRENQENKMTMTLVAVVFLFLICQTPAAITLIVKIFYNPERGTVGENLMGALNTIWNFLVVINAASNFVLYCVMSDKYRHTLLFTFFPSLAVRHIRTDTIITMPTNVRLSSVRRAAPNS